MLILSNSDFQKYGCPGCNYDLVSTRTSFRGEFTVSCNNPECDTEYFVILADDVVDSKDYKEGNTDYPLVNEHPNKIDRMVWFAPDIRPDVPDADFFNSRGIGYDLAGFVKSKEAGERIIKMTKQLLGTRDIKSWLDYREHEPNWIQVKFQKEEFDLELLDSLVRENNNIITRSILEQSIKEG